MAALAVAVAAMCLLPGAADARDGDVHALDLGQGWQFRQADSSNQHGKDANATRWRKATVPGTVHTDLFALGAIPDPYKGTVEADLQWIGLADWEYQRSFDVDKNQLDDARSELVFEGLDTFADVYLNGNKLTSTDNSFRTWRVPVQGKLKARSNQLRVVLHSPIRRVLPQVQAMPHQFAGNYPSPFGDEPKDAMTGNFVRKPGYHYGWDWGPRYVTAGIWKPVTLQSWDGARIDDLQLRQDALSSDRAELTARVRVDPARAGNYRVRLWQTDPSGKRSQAGEREVQLGKDVATVELPVQINQPQRWFPVGYGQQPLYHYQAELLDAQGNALDNAERRTGLRTVELRRDKDAIGRSFQFVVNGIPVFAKGANSIPFDMFEPRVTPAQLRRVMQSARDANMNMIRSWGGGYYESDTFFEIADELGLMVWQDFMFGGGMQPAYDPAFRANVVAEARDQIRRLRNHPSVVLWCGNNEEEIAWKYWGHGKDLTKADPAFAKKVWDGWVLLFNVDLRQVVAEEAGGIGYVPSSPSDDMAEDANKPHSGDMHYWEVWGNPAHPVQKYLEITPRFMSEFGLQAWPGMRTIRGYAGDAPLAIDSPVVTAHQKFMAGKGNERLLHYITMEYGQPRDFPGFVYLSQVMQADGIELAALHHRASRPTTMGTLYWQLNDVWPGASWSGIDWHGRWKPMQFHARRFFAPVAVAALRKEGKTTVSLLNDHVDARKGTLHMRLFDLDGKLLREQHKQVTLQPLAATVVDTASDARLLGKADPKRSVAVYDLAVDGEPPARGVVWFAHARDIAWPQPGVDATLARDGDHYRLDLHSKHVARALWIDFGDHDVELQDNALTLMPGETRGLRIDSPASLEQLRAALQLRSLADVLASSPSPTAAMEHAPQ